MTMQGQQFFSSMDPLILFVDRNTEEGPDYFGEEPIMVPLDPDHLNPTSGRRQLLHIRQQAPVTGVELGEVQLVKDVAEQDEPVKGRALERGKQGVRPAHPGSEVHIGDDQRIDGGGPDPPLGGQGSDRAGEGRLERRDEEPRGLAGPLQAGWPAGNTSYHGAEYNGRMLRWSLLGLKLL